MIVFSFEKKSSIGCRQQALFVSTSEIRIIYRNYLASGSALQSANGILLNPDSLFLKVNEEWVLGALRIDVLERACGRCGGCVSV